MGEPGFWDTPDRAQKHIAKVNGLKRVISGLVIFNKRVDDATVMVELIEASSPAEQRLDTAANLAAAQRHARRLRCARPQSGGPLLRA